MRPPTGKTIMPKKPLGFIGHDRHGNRIIEEEFTPPYTLYWLDTGVHGDAYGTRSGFPSFRYQCLGGKPGLAGRLYTGLPKNDGKKV